MIIYIDLVASKEGYYTKPKWQEIQDKTIWSRDVAPRRKNLCITDFFYSLVSLINLDEI